MPEHYTQLLEWRRAEGATRGLAKLPTEFYGTTRAYLDDVRRTYESELRENPSGKKGDLARQTYQRAVQIARDIIEARVTKLLAVAFQASVGATRDLSNALPEERRLFDGLVQLLRTHRAEVAPFLEATPPPPPAGTTPAAAPPAEARPSPAAEKAPGPSAPAAVVRVLKDGRPVEVGPETVDLGKEDVISLPPEAARLLVSAKVAELILPATRPVT